MPWLTDEAEPTLIDHGAIQGQPFVNMVSMGITHHIADRIASLPKGKFGLLVYLPAIWAAIRSVRSFEVNLNTSNGDFEGEVIQFVAASTRNHGGLFRVTQQAAIDDGLLSMYVVGKGNRAEMFRFGIALVRGNQGALPQVWETNAASATLTINRRKTMIADGDRIGRRSTWEVGIKEHALKVLAA
jgi:diacylglycerol kinase family enzyme